MTEVQWVDKTHVASQLGLIRYKSVVHDGLQIGTGGYAADGTHFYPAADLPTGFKALYSTPAGVFCVAASGVDPDVHLLLYKSPDGIQDWVLVHEISGLDQVNTLFQQVVGCTADIIFLPEYRTDGDPKVFWYSTDGGDTWSDLFTAAVGSITHFHGGYYDAAYGRLYVFTGDGNNESSILVCDDLDDLIANPATWSARWGLDDNTRSTLDGDYVIGHGDQTWRTVGVGVWADYLYYAADGPSTTTECFRFHRSTGIREQVDVPVHSPHWDLGTVGEAWAWGHGNDGTLLCVTAARATLDSHSHLYAVSEDGLSLDHIHKIPLQGGYTDGSPVNIQSVGGLTVIASNGTTPTINLVTQAGRLMLRGSHVSTFPQYDEQEVAGFVYGDQHNVVGGGTAVSITGTDARWACRTMPLKLRPGTYYLNRVFFWGSHTLNADGTTPTVDAAAVALFKKVESTAVPVAFDDGTTYLDLTDDIQSYAFTSAKAGPTLFNNVPFTIEEGETYYIGFAFHCLAGRTSGRPGFMHFSAGVGPQETTYYGESTGAAFPFTLTSERATSTIPQGWIRCFTSARYWLEDSYVGSAKAVLLPLRRHPIDASWGDLPTYIKFEDVVVEDGNSLTIELCRSNSGAKLVGDTIVLNMGATDQVTAEGANVALNAGVSEAGDTFDVLLRLSNGGAANGSYDVFWINKTTGQGPEGVADLMVRSHAVKNAGTRGSEHTLMTYCSYMQLSGTATVGSIQVGWQPVVFLGSNQVSIADERLGYHLPAAFTHDRIFLDAAIADNSLISGVGGGDSTPGYLRYRHGIPGDGDLCELKDVIFAFCCWGLEDIQAITAEEARNASVLDLLEKFAWMLADMQDNGNMPLIIGLPQYSVAETAEEMHAQAIRNQFNVGLEGLAIAARCAFLNPWWDCLDGISAWHPVPRIQPTYTDNEGSDLSSAGAAVIAALATTSFESGIVGGPWRKRYPQGRRPGMMLPL